MTAVDRGEIGRDVRRRGRWLAAVAVAVALFAGPPLRAEDPPWDDELMRLAEILGTLHHLRPLCGASDETQVWRDQMAALIAAEQPAPERAKKLTDRFNHAWRSIAGTHRTCTDVDRLLIERLTVEGAALAREVVARWGRS